MPHADAPRRARPASRPRRRAAARLGAGRFGAAALLGATLTVAGCSAPSTPAGPQAPAGDGPATSSASGAPSPTPLPSAPGVIRIGVPSDRPGLSQRDGDGAPAGLDADVAVAVAGYLGFEERRIEWVDLTTRSAGEALAAGVVDLAVGAVPVSPGDERVAVAGPYLSLRQDLLVRGDSPVHAPSELAGGRVCAAQDSPAAEGLRGVLPADAVVLTQGSTAECAAALRSGRVDAIAGDEQVLGGLARTDEGLRGSRLLGAPYATAAYGVGLPASSSLCRTVTAALAAQQADGRWARAADVVGERTGVAIDAAQRAASRPDASRCA